MSQIRRVLSDTVSNLLVLSAHRQAAATATAAEHARLLTASGGGATTSYVTAAEHAQTILAGLHA